MGLQALKLDAYLEGFKSRLLTYVAYGIRIPNEKLSSLASNLLVIDLDICLQVATSESFVRDDQR